MAAKPPPSPPAVVCEVPDGLGIIELTGDAGASLLALAGDPVLLEGNDGFGSIGWLAARAGARAPGTGEVKALTEWLGCPDLAVDPVTGHHLPPDPQRLRPLLTLLAPGRYVMTARQAPHRLRIVHPRGHAVEQWYPEEDFALLTTDHWPPRHEAAVRDHTRRIRGGGLPALVVLCPTPDSLTGYLLDGHHKLAAYHRAGVRPLILQLTPQQPKPFHREDYERARAAFLADRPDRERDSLGGVLAYIRDEARHVS
ncbi:hypothetical protein OOK31_00585 [Streptomyces sp. NBC_00249]|uniref:hypothetical protein n=1 Tax=Streptomyces sp. NBC_00249 TaxID=2975690 RepID=UPI002251C833|nr:hypothetical protein [Streptomyces sp. NBC_00249]MCX5192396.1 hypothetical protein [Streptomyces sp. NBC_00249]